MLISCKECHHSIASNAFTCPSCGAPTEFRGRTFGMLLLGLAILLVSSVLSHAFSQTGSFLGDIGPIFHAINAPQNQQSATPPALAEEPNEKLLGQVTGGKEQLCRVRAELAKAAVRSRDAGMPAYKVRQSLRRSAERSEQPRKLADAELQHMEAIVDFVYANPRLADDDAARSTYRSCLQRAAAEMRALVAPP
jgi:hypothetical protein